VDATRGAPAAGSDARILLVPYEEAYTAGFEDMRERVPNISKIQQYTGWEPSLALEHILRDVIATTGT
jgi:UDP-glucose 4-epimerase